MGTGLALAMLLGRCEAGRAGGCVCPRVCPAPGGCALRTLLFQRLDEPGHGQQRLLGQGGVLGELGLPGESCGEKKGRRGLEISACRDSTFLSCPRTGSSCCFGTATNNTWAHASNFGALLPLFCPLFAIRVTVGGSAACWDAKTCSGMCPARGEHPILGTDILQAKTPFPRH